VEGANWVGRAEAEEEVKASFERAKEHGEEVEVKDDSTPETGRTPDN
jgi:hypothetical protein